MAANKFATMLHRNTHKAIVILVYAVLEWVLILLLLLNSLFSYLIGKFASYFGLKPPCSWCSSINHYFEPNNDKNSYRELVCEAHAKEISKLCYCPNHERLAESERLCRDCLPLQLVCRGRNLVESSFFTWSENTCENEERDCRCSCCDEDLSSKHYPPSHLLKPSWGILEYTQKESSILEKEADEKSTSKSSNSAECGCDHDHEIKQTEEFSRQGLNFHCDVDEGNEFDKTEIVAVQEQDFNHADSVNQFFDEAMMIRSIKYDHGFDRLIPMELTDSSNISRQSSSVIRGEDKLGKIEELDEKFVSKQWIEKKVDLVREDELISAEAAAGVEGNESEVQTRHRVLEHENQRKIENSSILMAELKNQGFAVSAQTPCTNDMETATTEQTVSEEEEEIACKLQADGLETFDSDPARITSASKASLAGDCEGINLHLCENSEAKEIGEEKISLDPTSTDDQKGVAEEHWDGSEAEGDNGIERLKAELEAERKALSALYTELEEERNAAAIAANQTMAMITRLQEEKAAMQMEALQYQRMMDEQSEYDQEALQLLNELMIKREKEKQELEKELEIYRKKVSDGERMKMTRRRSGSLRSRSSSASCSNAEDNEELLIEADSEEREETDEAWADCLKHLGSLEESVNEFEEERLSILDELKGLEEKLFTLVDDEEQLFEDVKSIEQSPNDISNGLFEESDENDYGDRKSPSVRATRLLPLFDAMATEDGEEELNEEQVISQSTGTLNSLANYEMGKRVAIEEDIDHVYERLQALEADREFVKHCVSSLKKGDKGMDLLQEILQHLRDLKAVESQVRNISDSPFSCFST